MARLVWLPATASYNLLHRNSFFASNIPVGSRFWSRMAVGDVLVGAAYPHHMGASRFQLVSPLTVVAFILSDPYISEIQLRSS